MKKAGGEAGGFTALTLPTEEACSVERWSEERALASRDPPTEACWLTDEGIGWHGKQEPFSCALPSLRISVRYRAPVSTLTQHQGRTLCTARHQNARTRVDHRPIAFAISAPPLALWSIGTWRGRSPHRHPA